ncbi:prephenate dehydrogenase/arogenate dehydrogenase family protein [Streptomyces sp. CB02460]|uniref:prephenate dehydrogenase/arogenate dehydrogenase family protein n=1 Tax=Streptomyces sp. CB02460 TaxID=1703941 RepID=UPI00093B9BED|nr:prephenate dehydrogenase/arogenate dehydrogenase family protein [Streptomyces sp. CB02460]
MTSPAPHDVTVIGCGTLGTSLALALTRAGRSVALADRDPHALARAVFRGAGTELAPDSPPAGLVVVATPTAAVVDTLYEAQTTGLGRAYTDLTAGNHGIWDEARLRGCDLRGYVPGRPRLAARPAGPAAGLFAGRPWTVCPYPLVEPDALDAVDLLVRTCGAHRDDVPPGTRPSTPIPERGRR